MKLIDGKKISAEIREELKQEVKKMDKQPGLIAILVGDNPASMSYVKAKHKACEEVGIYSEVLRLPEDIKEKDLLQLVSEYNKKRDIHGILVQLPLPKHISEEKVIKEISESKDVDGFHAVSLGKMVRGQDTFLPATPAGIQELLMRSDNSPQGKNVVVVGRSNIVGKPIANILLQKGKNADATVTVVHSRTKDMASFTREADILIVAIGQPEFIKGNMVKEGAVVIDVGINRVEDSTKERGYKLVGDVDFEDVKSKVKAITPVPGGVGPMTITMLLKNTVKAAQK